MTTIKIQFTGNFQDLKNFLVCGCRYYSSKKLLSRFLELEYIFETDDSEQAQEELINCIEMKELDLWNINLLSIT